MVIFATVGLHGAFAFVAGLLLLMQLCRLLYPYNPSCIHVALFHRWLTAQNKIGPCALRSPVTGWEEF